MPMTFSITIPTILITLPIGELGQMYSKLLELAMRTATSPSPSSTVEEAFLEQLAAVVKQRCHLVRLDIRHQRDSTELSMSLTTDEFKIPPLFTFPMES